MANVSTKHPDWIDRREEWATMRHASRGETAVKAEGELYLPKPDAFEAQRDRGKAMYNAYKMRAQFPDILGPTARGMIGVIHRTEAQIEMPDAMQGLWERATADGLPLEAFHRRITSEILLTGRYGILVDAPSEGADLPFFAGYSTEALINWSPDRNFYVLDESGIVRNGFEWKQEKRFRVLELVDGRYSIRVYENTEDGNGEEVIPVRRGGGALDSIPFVVIGSRDLSTEPDDPPLIGVARAALAIYRLDADYRHQMFWSGQETLVIINGGENPPAAVGSGACIMLNGDDNRRPEAGYVGPTGEGIGSHRQAILDDRENAIASGARVFDSHKRAAESGEALKLRYAAQTATLTSIAQASAAGLEQGLRHIAEMIGADPTQVVVQPDLDHLQGGLTPQDAEALVRVWQAGGISYTTLYENLQRGEIASSERSPEEEMSLIDSEGMSLEEREAMEVMLPRTREPEGAQ